MFRFKHALSRFNTTITGDFDQDAGSGKTMITLKSIAVKMRLPRQAVLNLNNIYYNQPNWETDTYVYDYPDELMSEEIISYTADISKDVAFVDYGTNPELWMETFNNGSGGLLITPQQLTRCLWQQVDILVTTRLFLPLLL